MDSSTWYAGGAPLLRMAAIVACAYAALLVLRRSTRGRGLWNLTAVDLAAAIAIGVTLAIVVMSPQIPAVEAMLGLALLVALHALFSVAGARGADRGPSPRGRPGSTEPARPPTGC